jgi:Tol biopolymer transport system component
VLFERRGGDGDDLWTVDPNDGRLNRVTDCKDDCWSDNEAGWSPDGKQIAFGRATGPRSAQGPSLIAIYVANADGSDAHQVSSPPTGSEDHYPTWSADGKTLVFERNPDTSPPGRTTLVAVDVATRTEHLVYTLPPWANGSGIPKFSPGGLRILFSFWCIYGDDCAASTRASRNARLATINTNGTGLKVLPLRVHGDSGTWSPDGTRIAFRCWPKTGLRVGDFRLCASRLDGTQLRRFPWRLDSAHPDWGTHP